MSCSRARISWLHKITQIKVPHLSQCPVSTLKFLPMEAAPRCLANGVLQRPCSTAASAAGHVRSVSLRPGASLASNWGLAWAFAARTAARRSKSKKSATLAVVDSEKPDVLLVVGEGLCPWGEGGTETMKKALGLVELVPWPEAVKHLMWKVQQAVPNLHLQTSTENETREGRDMSAKLLVLINVKDAIHFQPETASNIANILVLSSGESKMSKLTARSGGDPQKVLSRCKELWSRDTAEDSFYALLFAIQFAVAPVPFVEEEPEINSLDKVWCLCSRCLNEALEAGLDAEARACLACQSECDVRDQTQMYRCTVSHESEALARLVRCFERRGIFDCEAEIPNIQFEPLQKFRGKPLTVETAWNIMEGHWDAANATSCSWRPVLGQNPAYDYFLSQYNSWYRDPRGNRGWYDPVFKVVTLDGRPVWRKRHYRVLPGEPIGSFKLSTEDNGISLKEFWRIVDADEKLTWAVLHYAGAAKSVGQSYTGSLLVTKNGTLKDLDLPAERIRQAFEKAGVAAFELYAIQQTNPDVESAPLTKFQNLPRYKDIKKH